MARAALAVWRPTEADVQEEYLRQAIELAVENVKKGGGPFAALVVRDGVVIASGANQVTTSNDPTAHAEVVAIRHACRALNTFQLNGCEIYSSCEPCPMCLGAIYWARPEGVYYGATREDAARFGFDDSFIYQQLVLAPSERAIPCAALPCDGASRPFEAWAQLENKIRY